MARYTTPRRRSTRSGQFVATASEAEPLPALVEDGGGAAGADAGDAEGADLEQAVGQLRVVAQGYPA